MTNKITHMINVAKQRFEYKVTVEELVFGKVVESYKVYSEEQVKELVDSLKAKYPQSGYAEFKY